MIYKNILYSTKIDAQKTAWYTDQNKEIKKKIYLFAIRAALK